MPAPEERNLIVAVCIFHVAQTLYAPNGKTNTANPTAIECEGRYSSNQSFWSAIHVSKSFGVHSALDQLPASMNPLLQNLKEPPIPQNADIAAIHLDIAVPWRGKAEANFCGARWPGYC